METECPLCEHGDRFDLEEGIAGQGITKTLVAEQLGMTVEEVHNHMMNHLSGSGGMSKINTHTREIQAGLDDKYSKYDMLFNNVVDLNSLLGSFITSAMSAPTAADITKLVKLAQEVRNSVNDLAKLKGEIANESQVTIIQYNQLKTVVMSNLCPQCRGKVIDGLNDEEFKDKVREMKR